MISDAMQGTDGTKGTDGTSGTKVTPVTTLKAKLRKQRQERSDWLTKTVLAMTTQQRESLLCRLVGDVAGRYEASGNYTAEFRTMVGHVNDVLQQIEPAK